MLAISPELLAGSDWAQHSELFFERFERIEGARLPGLRRHRNRRAGVMRRVDADLIARIRALTS
jgi:hypothetical protein